MRIIRPVFIVVSFFIGISQGCSGDAAGAAIPFSDIGSRATADYRGNALGILRTADATVLNAEFQKLAATVTSQGLEVASTAKGGGAVRLAATALGREFFTKPLPTTGEIEADEKRVTFHRPQLDEEYSVSVDGVRQDFIVTSKPAGEGCLRVDLALAGARAEDTAMGVRIILNGSGRELAYSRLEVFDAHGVKLAARLEVTSENSLGVFVDDASAEYPVTIDPTFSDADWVSMNPGMPGTNGAVYAILADGGGNLYIGGDFTYVGTVAANRIAKWDGTAWSALGSGADGSVRALALSGTTLYAGGAFGTAGGVANAKYVARWNGTAWSALGTGMNGNVRSLAVIGTNVYVGGEFTMAGTVTANYIARWNGSSWSAMGSGMNGFVNALLPSGTNLYAGGVFVTAGGTTVNRIAKWDGSSWSALGSGMNSTVTSLALSGSDLYAGGFFSNPGGPGTGSGIAKWNGSAWSGLGTGVNGTISSVAISGSDVYVGGFFTAASGVAAANIAKWNGSSWSALGSGLAYGPGLNAATRALVVIGTDLYAGGSFNLSGETPVSGIAKWSGSSWSGFGNSAGINGRINALSISGTDLYAGGEFTLAGGISAHYIAKWNGSAWSALGTGLNSNVYALAVVGTNVYAGGWFTTAGGTSANRIARWNGSAWSALGSGMDGPVVALVASGTTVYAGGSFTTAGAVTANGVARWNGSSWFSLGTGMSGGGGTAEVNALALTGGNLYAGGGFTAAGGTSANNIARWNGSSWSALGFGVNSAVSAVAASGSDIFVGGGFTSAGGVSVNRIANWNGAAWSALGSGVNDLPTALVTNGTDLYAGGWFTTAGGSPANCIAKWNGSAWSALGSGVAGYFPNVTALVLDSNNRLYAGGNFFTAGGKASPNFARANLEGSTVPVVTTATAGSITSNSAALGGNITNDGGMAIIERGIVYSETALNANPLIGGANVTFLSEPGFPGTFAMNVDSLTPAKNYTFKAFASNSIGAAYSPAATFTTLAPPEIAVELSGTEIANDGSKDFGSLLSPASASLTFTIRNTGGGPLEGGPVIVECLNNDNDFTITSPAVFPVAPGASTQVTVRFSPSGTGRRTASFALSSNDPDEGSYLIHLTGTGSGPGNVETGFAAPYDPAPSSGVRCIALQPDGRMVVGGKFAIGESPVRRNLMRLDAAGSRDTTFQADVLGDDVFCVAIQADGKILVGGSFFQVGGTARYHLARTLADGSVDAAFSPVLNEAVHAMALQPDGKILIAGFFTSVNGQPRNYLARLNPDGTLDAAFDPGADGFVASIAFQDDGKILIGGAFGQVSGLPREGMARLSPAGVLDPSFNPNVSGGSVNCMLVQPGGKIVIAGLFGSVGNVGNIFRSNIARLNADGTLDGTFSQAAATNSTVLGLSGQADGKILLAGMFSQVASQNRQNLARLNANGTLDTAFDPALWQYGNAAVLQADGRILLGGDFDQVGGLSVHDLARLENDAATQSLTIPSATRIQWLRGGTSPEASQISFELSTDGTTTWSALGMGTRIAGGWELTGIALPAGGHIRARARVAGGYQNGSSGFHEAVSSFGVTPVPEIALEAPAGTDRPNHATVDFGVAPSTGGILLAVSVRNVGAAPLTGIAAAIDGVNAADFSIESAPQPSTPGATSTPCLIRFNPASAGTKTARLLVSSNDADENPFELILTGRAIAPALAVPPAGATIPEDRSTELSVTGTGSHPLTYQWYTGAPGVTTNPVGEDSRTLFTGELTATTSFWVRISNSFGAVDSPAITVTVLQRIPVFTSPANITAREGEEFGVQIVATMGPLAFSSPDLPPWLELDPDTGWLAGTPPLPGTWDLPITAANDRRSTTVIHRLTVLPRPPEITSAIDVVGRVGDLFTYAIVATNSPTSYTATGLPAGLTLDGSTGVISGIPTVSGSFNVPISARNAGGVDTEPLNITVMPPAPVISVPASVPGKVDVPFSYTIVASHSPISFGASGLPPGLSFDDLTGVISGTPTTSGTFPVNVSATNSGGTGTGTLTVNIAPPAPAISSPATATGRVSEAFSYDITASNSPTSFGAAGLPAGLTISAATGAISGTPSASGFFNVTLSAVNGGGTGTMVLGLTILTQPPAITSAAAVAGQVGVAFSYTITGTSSPTSFGASGLPEGLSLSSFTGVISGNPVTSGSFMVDLSATNAGGTGTASLALTIHPPAPAITSTATATGRLGEAFSYEIMATNSPIGFSATGLPGGLSLDTASGVIGGTPTVSGTFTVTLSATNGGGTGTRSLALTILPQPPVISSATTAGGKVGVAFSYTITGSSSPTSFSSTALPQGLSLNTGSGLISGNPTVSGTFTVTLSATNIGGTGTQSLVLTILPATPVISSGATASGKVSVPFSFTITANNSPDSFSAAGLPTGLVLAGAVISGTPETAGTYTVTLSATNTGGTGTQNLIITILPASPVIGSTALASGKVGVAFSYSITASNSPTSYNATGLPSGLGVSTSTGVINGTPAVAGTFTVNLSATNSGGSGTQNLTLIILPATPVITSAATAGGRVAVAFNYTITASNSSASFGAVGLPDGLVLNTTSGVISGTPTVSGSFTVNLSATNTGGTGTASLALTILPPVPVITSAATATGRVGEAFTYTITATESPTSFAATGLPAGLGVVTSTGIISGTPTASGTFTVNLSATNSGGTGTRSLTLTILPQPPVVTSAATANGRVAVAFSYSITGSNSPTSYNATGLPAGLGVSTSTGLISGTPTVAGSFTVNLSATNAGGTGTSTLTLTILPPVPAITSATTAGGKVGEAFTYTITASHSPTGFNATNLPAGLAVDPSTGVITGTPTTIGTFSVVLSATNGGGTGTRTLTLTILPQPPVIGGADTASARVGFPFSYTISASNSPASFAASPRPSGLSLSASGVLSGTPTTAGNFLVNLSATNSGGTGTKTLSITVLPPAPAIVEFFTGYYHPFDLDWKSIEFIPDGTGDYQVLPAASISSLPINSSSHQTLIAANTIDVVRRITLTGGKQFPFYGQLYGKMDVNPSGLIMFSSPGVSYIESVPLHQNGRQIALFWDDFATTGTPVRWQQFEDRVVITFQNVSEYHTSNQNTAQAELFFDGRIRFSYGRVDSWDSLVGLSNGSGVPNPRFVDYDNLPPPVINVPVVTGVAVDGYLVGTTVFFDADSDGMLDAGEPSTETDDAGGFSLGIDVAAADTSGNGSLDAGEGRLASIGGMDISTGLRNTVTLTAPPGAAVISPLSTLVQAIVEADPTKTPAAAEGLVKAAFGIPAGISLLNDDPVAAALAGGPGAVSTFARSINLAVFLSQAGALVSGGNPESAGDASAVLAAALADIILQGGAVDLSDPATISGILTSAASEIPGLALTPQQLSGAAGLISASNALVNGAPGVTAIVQSQTVAQGPIVEDLSRVASGEKLIGNLIVNYSPAVLAQLASQAPVGSISGTETGSGTFEFGAASYAVNEDGSDSPSVTVVRRNGGQGTVKVIVSFPGGTATPGADYSADPIELVFGPGEISKAVDLSQLLDDDSDIESVETISMTLALDPKAPVDASVGVIPAATLNLQDNDSPGMFFFTAAHYEVSENGSAFSPVIITRSGGTAATVNLVLTPQGTAGGAVAGRDFIAGQVIVTFNAGDRNKLVTLPLINGTTFIGTRRMELAMAIGAGSAAGAATGTHAVAEIDILEDDPRPSFQQWISATSVPVHRRSNLDRNGPLDLPNLLAYAMGLDPMTARAADLPVAFPPDQGTGLLRFIYRRNKDSTGVVTQIQSSTGLGTWSPATIQKERQIQDGGTFEWVEVLIPVGQNKTLFVRLKVVLAE
jgi:uncharacterized delta-60 repeat protein